MERWMELVRLLRQDGGVRRAAASIESSQGSIQYSDLWKLIPELLARQVTLLDDDVDPRNCLWIETLPSAMQADVLTLIYLQFNRFRSSDLLQLAEHLLDPDNNVGVSFWVRRAAQALLHKCSGSTPYRGDIKARRSFVLYFSKPEASDFDKDFDKLPDFLKATVDSNQAKSTSRNFLVSDSGSSEENVGDGEDGEEVDYWNLKVSDTEDDGEPEKEEQER